MTQENTNQEVSSLHFYENTRWRLLSNTLWNGLILVILVSVVLVGGLSSERFLSSGNVQNITWIWLTSALLVPTMGLIIASGGLDLSVGSVAGLTAIVVASLVTSGGTSLGVALIVGLCLAFFVGLVNGFLIGVIKLNAVVVTLAMMTMLRGLSYMITQNPIVVADAGFLSSLAFPGVVLVLLIIVCLVATELKLVSDNKKRLKPENKISWIRQSLLIGLPYIFSSLMAGFVGALYLGRLRTALPTIGFGLEFDVILLTMLGGTPFGSGFVNLLGAVLTALLFAIVQNISALNGISPFSVNTGKGAALLIFGSICHVYYYIVNLIFVKTGRKALPEETQIENASKPD
jgi:ribose transport system permease protein